MKAITTDELAQILAGGDSFIRTKKGEVKGLAITTDKNPEAPDMIVVGKGPRKIANAKLFLESRLFVPVYIKQTTNSWKYLGSYKADSYHQDIETIEKYRKHRKIDEIDGILFLSEQDDIEINVSSRNTPDVEAKKRTEISAINFVTEFYQKSNYVVTDRQEDNCGYDLLVERNGKALKVEVKGTVSSEQRFFLSRRERAKSIDPLWRLAIVTQAVRNPELEIFDPKEMEDKFNFDALCWECTVSQV
jgi:hypothetical protein